MCLAEGPADDCLSLEAVVGADRAQLLLLGRCFGVVERHLGYAGRVLLHARWLAAGTVTQERHTNGQFADQGSVNFDARHACL